MAYNFQPKTKEITTINELKETSKIIDPGQKQIAQNSAKNKTLKTLNALKIISPLIQGLIISSKDEELSENFKSMVSTVSDLSNEFCLKLDLDPTVEKNFWIRNSFERVFSELIKQQWVSHNNLDVTNIKSILSHVIEHSDFVEAEYQSMGLDIDSDIKINLIRSMISLLSEMQSGFNLNRNFIDDIEPIVKLIFEQSKEHMLQIIDENADTKQKSNLLKMLTNEGVNLYCASWKSYAKFTKDYLENLEKTDINTKNKLMKKYQNGFPLNKVNEEFTENFNRLITITKKIIPNKTGTLEKRMTT